MIEELVQLLIRVVDAELLEAVQREVLESKDIEDSKEPRDILARIRAVVDMVDLPSEGAGIECLCHRVPVLSGLLHLQRDFRDITANVYLSYQHHFGEILHLETQQRCNRVDYVSVLFRQLASLAVDVLEA